MEEDRAPELHVDYFDQEHNETDNDVLTWQTEMAWRGWPLDTDQDYGPLSEEACRRFQASKRLTIDGQVGPETWGATWNTPVDALEIVGMKVPLDIEHRMDVEEVDVEVDEVEDDPAA